MLNKKKLIQLILGYNKSENTFYDLKQKINLNSDSGKAKLLKHISAFSNSNPENESYLIVGISDNKDFIGIEYLDDSRIQIITNHYLLNKPNITFENVSFPSLPKGRFIGLITIHPSQEICSFKNTIDNITAGSIYIRDGSTSIPVNEEEIEKYLLDNNEVVTELKKGASVKLSELIDETLSFYDESSDSYNPKHFVFNDQFIVCLTAWRHNDQLWSEALFKILNENVSFFYSALQYITYEISESEIEITEYQHLVHGKPESRYYPMETKTIHFKGDGEYSVSTEFVFEIPKINDKILESYIEKYKKVVNKLRNGEELTEEEFWAGEYYCDELLLCILNGKEEAQKLFGNYWEGKIDGSVAECYHRDVDFLNRCYEEGVL